MFSFVAIPPFAAAAVQENPVGGFSPGSNISHNKKRPDRPFFVSMVEMARIELASKNTSAKCSPSAAFVSCFAFPCPQRQGQRSAIP